MTPESLKKNRPLAAFPTSEPAKKVAALFHRKLTTAWSEKEIKTFRKLVTLHCFSDLGDLAIIERYYCSERRKGDRGIHRRDLSTFLNNFSGELDRANAWAATLKPVRTALKILPPPVREVSDEEWERNREHCRAEKARLKQQLFGGNGAATA